MFCPPHTCSFYLNSMSLWCETFHNKLLLLWRAAAPYWAPKTGSLPLVNNYSAHSHVGGGVELTLVTGWLCMWYSMYWTGSCRGYWTDSTLPFWVVMNIIWFEWDSTMQSSCCPGTVTACTIWNSDHIVSSSEGCIHFEFSQSFQHIPGPLLSFYFTVHSFISFSTI
jgi:hypothetical protein